MANQNGFVDKNLSNVVEQLEEEAVNAHHANQLQRKAEDRKHQDEMNHDETPEERSVPSKGGLEQ